MAGRTALVFGGTGLIGKAVTEELSRSDNYKTVIVFTRRKSEIHDSSKIYNPVVDFEHIESFANQIRGEDIFICLGTTIKKAGSVGRMEEIDRDLPVSLAKKARENGAKRIAVVSSIGAKASSGNYYLRIKGEMEQGILGIDFETTAILRPSLLLGDRGEKRTGESAAKIFMKLLGLLLIGKFRKYRAIEGRNVAKAMIRMLENKNGKKIYESDQVQDISNR